MKRPNAIESFAENCRYMFGGLLVTLSAAIIVTADNAFAQCATSASNVAFGAVNPAAGAITTGTVTANCPGGFGSSPYLWACIGIGVGTNSASVANRTMRSGANSLSYQLFTEPTYTTVYTLSPPNNQFAVPYSNTTGAVVSGTTYARIASGQTAPPGTYTDSYSGIAQSAISGNIASTLPGNCSGAIGPISFSVTATISAACSVSATNINFGSSPSIISANRDATGSLSVLCTNTTPYRIALSYGTGAGAGIGGARYLRGPGGVQISYNLYRDAGRTLLWGDSLGVNTVNSTGTGVTQAFTVHGRVPPQSASVPGTFNDTITVVVDY